MAYFIEWQLKAGAILALMVLIYVTFLSRDSLFNRNRMWLVSTLVLPWLMPLLAMPLWLKNLLYQPKVATEIRAIVIEGVEQSSVAVSENQPLDWVMMALGFYLLLSVFFLVRMIWGYSIIFVLKQKSSKTEYDGLKVNWLRDKDINPFSFYRSIFLPKALENKPECNHILEHEKAHCRQWHSVDISLAEIILVLQWWNPFAWWLRQLIAQNHEFCVDKAVMQATSEPKHYQYSLMNFLPGSKGLKLVNNFSQSLIKKRIIMMNNSKNNSFLIYLKGICITAVMLVTLMAFTNPERTKEQVVESEKVEEIATTEDLHKYIARNIKYPTEARQNNIEGKVVANVKVNNKGVVGKPKIGAAKGGDVVKIDELVVVAYEEPGAGSESVPEANQLLGTEVENVLTKLPKINNVDLQGKTLEFNVKFELQKKKTPSMVGRDVKVKNALGQEFTLLLTETGFTLEGPKTNQPAFVVDRKEVSLSVLKELNAEEVKIIGYGPIGNDLKGRISDSSNGSFTIITNDFYESKRNEIRVKPKGNPLYVLNDAVYKGEINDIDPENIHSISVIKGQKAVDKYGEEASDGVVEIITKEYAIEKGLPLDKGVLKTRTINVEGKGEASVVIDKKAWNKEPLFIVDGERVNANDVDNESIESVNVIKGQSAIDKYGEDAKNGVVEITTKLGAEKRKSSDAISIKSTDDIKFDQITISADSGSEPVYIVDGTRQYGQKVAAEDIESVNFIKGSNAIDKYGEDAKNGAVEFTTKEYENNVIPGQSLNSVKVVRYGSYAVDSKDSHPHFRIKSNTNGKKPLYVIDGEEVDGEVFENLDKKSIESMTVLKDKSAKDLYGEKARDGVIVITLKN